MNKDTYDCASWILQDMNYVADTIARLKSIEDSGDPISLHCNGLAVDIPNGSVRTSMCELALSALEQRHTDLRSQFDKL
jgi:hypothetical protein